MKRLTCQSCGSSLNLDTYDSRYEIISCSHCGGRYDASELISLNPNLNKQAKPSSPESIAPKPENLNVRLRDGGVEYSWRNQSLFGALFMIGFFALFMFFFVPVFTRLIGVEFSWFKGNLVAFDSINWLLIVGFLWLASALLLNSNRVSLSKGKLRSYQGPVPWGWRKSVSSKLVAQLFVARRVVQKKEGNPDTYYVLNGVDINDNLIQFPGRFTNIEAALFVEHGVESKLGLADSDVVGEVSRD